ncbi:MAG: hypothetical protein IIC81_02905, partial [Chloroflexi bacterium]|nr:hypothetical protein [Chloroflexota bacterium]
MKKKSNWIEEVIQSNTAEEFIEVTAIDVSRCCKEVATGRAVMALLESEYPSIRPKGDRALERLRAYGLANDWQWSSEQAMARDVAELVEDMEAVRQEHNNNGLQYRSILSKLVADKLDMDRGQEILEALVEAEAGMKEEVFKQLQKAVIKGLTKAVQQLNQELPILQNDCLAAFKLNANAELEKRRFVRPATSTRD